ncbi:MAG: DUF389 domain-containing protein, partial [Actinomycetia bacterium]|nr:DUF389 domain-containing protein [Actinomycetes bacterium]
MTTPDEVQQLTTDPDVDELEDLEISPGFDRSQIEWSVLRSPIVVRALAGATVATLVLIWPTRTDRILANLIGIGLLVLSSISIWSLLRSRSRVVIDGLVALGGLGAGVFVLASPAASEVALSRLVGAAIVVAAGRDLVRLHVRALVRSQPWSSIRVVSMLGAGGLLLAFPAELFAASTILFALAWMASAVLVLVISITSHSEEPSGFVDSAHLVGAWLIDRPKSVEDRQALYDRILYEGPMTTQRLVRFFTLMSFASIIASMGVIADSTAVVIGAMLIAPLMTPLMGMAISLVMGWPRRLTRSTLVAGAGIILSIGLGVVWGLATPTVIDTTTNSQIVARSSPTVLDLIIALAAGAAGAYALSRPDVSDSLPGVAISIALVPPLSVVGISYAQGDWSSGHGALLLFATNMLAILVMGGLTFVATGVTPV